MDRQPEQQIEHYLRRLAGHLYGADRQTIDDALEEMRQHLRSACDDFVRNGYSAEEAVQLTLKKFGPADRVGESLARRLAPESIYLRIYWVLRLGDLLRFVSCFVAVQQVSGMASRGVYFLAGMVVALFIGCLMHFVDENRRGIAQSNFIARRCLRIGEAQRTLRQYAPENVSLGQKSYPYFILAIVAGLNRLDCHQYGFASFWLTQGVYGVVARILAARLAKVVSA